MEPGWGEGSTPEGCITGFAGNVRHRRSAPALHQQSIARFQAQGQQYHWSDTRSEGRCHVRVENRNHGRDQQRCACLSNFDKWVE
jgi:hypothetical protein